MGDILYFHFMPHPNSQGLIYDDLPYIPQACIQIPS